MSNKHSSKHLHEIGRM